MKVVMDPDKAEITVDCTFKNVGDKPLKMAVWQITQCAPGGLAIVPLTRKMPKLPAGFKPGEFPRPTGSPFSQRPMPGPDDYIEPDRLIALFAIADIQDTRFYADNSYITLVQEAEIRRPFKLGIANYDGWAMYINKDKVLKFKHEHVKGATYTDGGCSFEIYTDANFLEVETLGQYKELLPGDEITHTEQISLFDALLPRPGARDSEALEAFVEKHL